MQYEMKRKDLLHILGAYSVVLIGAYGYLIYFASGVLLNGLGADIIGTVIMYLPMTVTAQICRKVLIHGDCCEVNLSRH